MSAAKDKPVSKPATDAYRDNYDKIFRKDKCINGERNMNPMCKFEWVEDGDIGSGFFCVDCGLRYNTGDCPHRQ